MKIAINGFGRIGKNFLRVLLTDPMSIRTISVVAINIGDDIIEHVAHLFKYDTIMGHYPGIVEQKGSTLIVDGHEIEILQACDPQEIDWKKRQIDWVVDCSGKFTHRADAEKHLRAGAQRVLISAPAHDEDVSIVPGVNDFAYDATKHKIVSLGSCTTNALMPLLKVLHQECGLIQGTMTTVHAYTNTQRVLDSDCSDLRRARAAALNIIPSTTGAAQVVSKIMPELAGKISTSAVRVPVGIVSFLTVTFVAQKPLTAEQINAEYERYATTVLRGILDITRAPLVSSDFIQTTHSVIIDAPLTTANGTLATVSGWYDNEWAYSTRMKDFLLHTGA